MKTEKHEYAQCPRCTVTIKIPDTAQLKCPYCNAKLKVVKSEFGSQLKQL